MITALISVNQPTEFPEIRVESCLEAGVRAHILDLRWRVLRAPWGQPRGSERDDEDDRAVHALAVLGDGQVVGVGRLHRRSASEGQIRYMAVEEVWRGRGVGARILNALEEEAVRRGFGRMMLEARAEAVPFYHRHGYRVEGEGKVLFGAIAHAVMGKVLTGQGGQGAGENK